MIRVEVRGARELARAFHGSDDFLDRALRPGFKRAADRVEGAATRNVHKVTRKLAGSLGSVMDGHGASLEARIGPQPGTAQPRGYTAAQTSRWKKPRKGRNTGDPQVYAQFEEEGTRYRPGHPFLEPAADDNVEGIASDIQRSIDDAIGGFGR